jgi:hypothetical protein
LQHRGVEPAVQFGEFEIHAGEYRGNEVSRERKTRCRLRLSFSHSLIIGTPRRRGTGPTAGAAQISASTQGITAASPIYFRF